MRIAQIPSTVAPVRRGVAASVECLVWSLSHEFTALGHEVTTFGVRGSEPCGRFVETVPAAAGQPNSFPEWHEGELVNLCRGLERSAEFDVIHTHCYLWSIPLQNLSRAPLVHTLHTTPQPNQKMMWGAYPQSVVTALSEFQWRGTGLVPAAVVPHGIDPRDFPYQAEPGSYLCYLGRFMSGKGPVEAIRTAKGLGRQILLAGGRSPYFEEHVAPLVDGEQVQYVGMVTGNDRSELLRNAACLVYPLRHPEPFGLVLIEAMMCGTPVAAVRIGAVPEIVEEGVTGFTADSMEGLPECVSRALALDRSVIRAQTEQKFSSRRMAEDYARLYERVLRGDFR